MTTDGTTTDGTTTSATTTDLRIDEGYAPVTGGVRMYWRSLGEGGTPLVVVHGGFGDARMFGEVLDRLAAGRRVVAVELQGHGHTADVDRPFGWDAFADDVAALVRHLDPGPVDLMGYSSEAASCCAPRSGTRRLRAGWSSSPRRAAATGGCPTCWPAWPASAAPGSGGCAGRRPTPPYAAYAAVAPDVDAFPALVDETGDLIRAPYDWTEEVRALTAPVQLVHGDCDGVPPAHAAEFSALLGSGLRDPGWDGSGGRPASRLAILPGRTHYDVFSAPELAPLVDGFLLP
jgi:pimeloyl-ACP methyl ester carboxylesterase